MKILLTNHNFSIGGVRSFMFSLSAALKSDGHHCELFFFEQPPVDHYLPLDCKVHFGDLAACMRLVKTEGFEIVQANNYGWWTGISAVRSIGAKLIINSHGRITPGKWTFGWNSTNCDAFTACANWIVKELQPYTDVPIQVVLNGIDTAKFRAIEQAKDHANPIVAWVGRSNDLGQKRIDKFASIGLKLRRAGLKLWIADPCGPDSLALTDAGVANTLRPIAERWERVPVEKMPHFYQEIAASGGCVVSTSSFEGLPLTLLEAQASGCPVIAPNVRGVNECVDPKHGGVLYPFEIEAEQLADLVIETLRDKEKMQWRQAACARYARERFSLARMAQEYLNIYRESPYAQRGSFSSKARARLRLSPLLHWRDYIEYRWKVGFDQYKASVEMAEQSDWALASDSARASLLTSPTVFLRPGRIAHFIKAELRRRKARK